jgi:DNA-binding SARP family transcriptional activator
VRVDDAGSERGSGDRAERDPALHAVEKLLEEGKYEELEQLLADEVVSGVEPPGVAQRILDSIRVLCRAGSESRSEAAWHEQALARVLKREQELLRSLRSAIALVPNASGEAPGGFREGVRFPTAAGEPESSGSLVVYCLGEFRVFFDGRPVEGWSNGKGKAILKFLLVHQEHRAGKEVLMERFWPEAEPDAARNSLNVAIYALRRAFASVTDTSVLLFRDDSYLLNPRLPVWIDGEAFLNHLAAGHDLERRRETTLAIEEYRRAEALYQGDLFQEDRYEDWLEAYRRDFSERYLTLLVGLEEYAFAHHDYGACVDLCKKMLAVDPCHEEPHRRLMQCWSRQGLAHLALRQFHVCREALARELEVDPSPDTTEVFDRIRRREPV